MVRTLFFFSAVATLLHATHASEIQDSKNVVLVPHVNRGQLDIDVDLRAEMDAEFANLQLRAPPTNFQVFTQSLGGPLPEAITASPDPQRPFQVNGETFTSLADAVQRSCAIQNDLCSKAANAKPQSQNQNGNQNQNQKKAAKPSQGSGGAKGNGQQGAKAEGDELTVPNCEKQQSACRDANKQLAEMRLDEQSSTAEQLVFC
ncbi:hypothetical protein HYFRA_00001762 [Hymenoscyphus fraxineus]|uniref:Uncharacterized protein n=1 Tax=Hymenoscyphus fraxineus TaxID=746836 RepID=A0A9N9KL42_9HELO|nr:hypothetical protein HYFRA_00001762 [Hymenoscyphus fraxineus]